MTYLRSFLPWIAFAALSSVSWAGAALAGLVIAVALMLVQRRNGTGWDALVLETSSAVYFVALTAIALAAPQSEFRHYSGAASLAWLALVAWAGLVAGKPFTLGIAKQGTPREFWDLPQFKRVNVIITSVWAVAFTVTAILVGVLYATTGNTGVSTVVQIAGFVVPAVFTVRYSALVRARAAALQAQAQTTRS